MKLEFLWDIEKTRILLKRHLLLVSVGSIPSLLYGFFFPGTILEKGMLIATSLVIILLSLISLVFLRKFSNPGLIFLFNILVIQFGVSVYMMFSGGLLSIMQFVPYALLFITVFQLGSQATLVLSGVAIFNLLGLMWVLLIQQPYPRLILDFFLYLVIYIILTIIFRNIGNDLSVQIEGRKRLEQIDDLKNQFISLSSHYLRTPLTVIKGSVDNLKQQLKDYEQLKLIGNVDSSVQILDNLIEKFLMISSIERGQTKLNLVKSNLKQLVKEIVEHYRPIADAKGLILNYLPETSQELEVKLDPVKFKQALSNILENALEYNKQSGSISIGLDIKNNQALIQISDTGIGIEQSRLDTLFTTFNKGSMDKTLNFAKPGIGLSLYLTKLIIDAHGGQISVSSILGVGTTFIITLPITHES